ncbi:MAG: hypothetical protein KAW92_05440 [Candidatus Cloacimonetes bacterium]|nr:hypothetical protein [Candidatus Cloacimonadota bacterium]
MTIKTKSKETTYTIFKKESNILQKSKETLLNKNLPNEDLQNNYILLNQEYEKLLKLTVKVTKISDKYQIKLLHANEKIEKQKKELENALEEIKTLSGFIPICSHCKKVRDDKGYWNQVEQYISKHSEAKFSHAICPDCMRKLYPKQYKKLQERGVF